MSRVSWDAWTVPDTPKYTYTCTYICIVENPCREYPGILGQSRDTPKYTYTWYIWIVENPCPEYPGILGQSRDTPMYIWIVENPCPEYPGILGQSWDTPKYTHMYIWTFESQLHIHITWKACLAYCTYTICADQQYGSPYIQLSSVHIYMMNIAQNMPVVYVHTYIRRLSMHVYYHM